MGIRGWIIVAAVVAAFGAGKASVGQAAPVASMPAGRIAPASRPAARWAPATRRAVSTGPAVPGSQAAASQVAGIRPVAGQAAMLRADNPKHDYGKVWDTDGVAHTFEMVNTGERAVTISGVHSSCGCTTADKWAKQVAPGETWQLPVKFNPSGRRGRSSKSITVDTDDPGARQVVFLLEGEVQPRFNMTTNVNFGTLRQDTVVKKTITITNNGDEPVKLKGAKVDLPLLKVDLREIDPGRKYELDIETVPPLNMQSIRGKITLETDLKEQPEVTAYASAYVQPRISLMPQMVMVQQPLEQEFRRRLVLKAMEGVTIHIKEAKASNPQIEVTLEPVREGQEYSVWLKMQPGLSLPAGGETVTITTDDEQMPTLTASVRSFVAPRSRNPVTGATAADTQRSVRVLDRMPVTSQLTPPARPATASQPQND